MAPTKGCQLRQEKHKVLNNTLVRKIIICSLKTQLVMTTSHRINLLYYQSSNRLYKNPDFRVYF